MRFTLALALVASLSVAAYAAEVESLEEMLQEGGVMQAPAEAPAKEAAPAKGVVGLTNDIKGLQADISNIRSAKEKASSASASALKESTLTAPGADQDKEMSKHIDAGAKAQDLSAIEHQKKEQLADLTIEQHEAAKNAAIEANPSASTAAPADDAGSD